MISGRGTPDQAPARLFAYTDPRGFALLIDILVERSANYLIRQFEAGVDAVQIFDSWAGTLAPGEFQRWCIDPTRKLIEKLRKEFGDTPGIPLTVTQTGITRSWTSFSEAVQEVIDARVYSGIHFRNSDEVGARMGRQVAQFVSNHALRPAKGK